MRWKHFTISTITIVDNASANAITNSSKPKSVARLNTSAIGSMKTTALVSSSASANEPQSHMFCPFLAKMLPCWVRMLKLWKISARFIVKNAMVMPCGLAALPITFHVPRSRKCPMQYAATVIAASITP